MTERVEPSGLSGSADSSAGAVALSDALAGAQEAMHLLKRAAEICERWKYVNGDAHAVMEDLWNARELVGDLASVIPRLAAEEGGAERARVPQLDDDVVLTLELPPTTEEWADDLLGEEGLYDITRTSTTLAVEYRVGGNCNTIACAASFLRDVEEALAGGRVDPMTFTLYAESEERRR